MGTIFTLAYGLLLLVTILVDGGEAQKSMKKRKNNVFAVCNEVSVLCQKYFRLNKVSHAISNACNHYRTAEDQLVTLGKLAARLATKRGAMTALSAESVSI